MSHKDDLALMSHLMRRAGFGASRDELERRVAQGYESTVEELLDPPEELESGKMALMLRYHPSFLLPGGNPLSGQANWMYQMISTEKPATPITCASQAARCTAPVACAAATSNPAPSAA